jgi:hypothetical protein
MIYLGHILCRTKLHCRHKGIFSDTYMITCQTFKIYSIAQNLKHYKTPGINNPYSLINSGRKRRSRRIEGYVVIHMTM